MANLKEFILHYFVKILKGPYTELPVRQLPGQILWCCAELTFDHALGKESTYGLTYLVSGTQWT